MKIMALRLPPFKKISISGLIGIRMKYLLPKSNSVSILSNRSLYMADYCSSLLGRGLEHGSGCLERLSLFFLYLCFFSFWQSRFGQIFDSPQFTKCLYSA